MQFVLRVLTCVETVQTKSFARVTAVDENQYRIDMFTLPM
jgi:hypothetical protein